MTSQNQIPGRSTMTSQIPGRSTMTSQIPGRFGSEVEFGSDIVLDSGTALPSNLNVESSDPSNAAIAPTENNEAESRAEIQIEE